MDVCRQLLDGADVIAGLPLDFRNQVPPCLLPDVYKVHSKLQIRLPIERPALKSPSCLGIKLEKVFGYLVHHGLRRYQDLGPKQLVVEVQCAFIIHLG